MRILVAEDDPDLQDAYLLALEKEGYEVIKAFDGKEAVAKAEEQKPDLILMDIMMPGFDGMTVLKMLKANSSLSAIPVVMMTNVESETLSAMGAGAAWYFVKSNISLGDVIQKIREILKS